MRNHQGCSEAYWKAQAAALEAMRKQVVSAKERRTERARSKLAKLPEGPGAFIYSIPEAIRRD
jgi:hypothetical protein